MDFKVAGTGEGITTLQMDIKIAGITEEIMQVALAQAKEGRAHILGEMAKALDHTREELSAHAPRIETMQIDKSKIRDVIGTGGKVIREIVADDRRQGRHRRRGRDQDQLVRPQPDRGRDASWIQGIVEEPEVGKIYNGKVVNIVDFGAFVNFMGGKDGLVHVSEIKNERVENVRDALPKARRSRSRCSRSIRAARFACRCASSTRRPAPSWKTPVRRAKAARIAARAVTAAIAARAVTAAVADRGRGPAAMAVAVAVVTATAARAAKAAAIAPTAARARSAATTTAPRPNSRPPS